MRASHYATLIVKILKNEMMDNLHLAAEAGRDDTGVEVSELSYIGHAQSSPLAPPPSAPMPLALPPSAPAPSAAVDMPHHHRHHPSIERAAYASNLRAISTLAALLAANYAQAGCRAKNKTPNFHS